MENTDKKIIFEGITNRYQIKKLVEKKEKKSRQVAKTWNIKENDKEHDTQLNIIRKLIEEKYNALKIDNHTHKVTISHLKSKLAGYKHQDVLKKVYQEDNFITFQKLLELLVEFELKCNYCKRELYILYEYVREPTQWTLDRIDNDQGHNTGNLLISCLECNLKRKVMSKDRFYFSKNLEITREGIDLV